MKIVIRIVLLLVISSIAASSLASCGVFSGDIDIIPGKIQETVDPNPKLKSISTEVACYAEYDITVNVDSFLLPINKTFRNIITETKYGDNYHFKLDKDKLGIFKMFIPEDIIGYNEVWYYDNYCYINNEKNKIKLKLDELPLDDIFIIAAIDEAIEAKTEVDNIVKVSGGSEYTYQCDEFQTVKVHFNNKNYVTDIVYEATLEPYGYTGKMTFEVSYKYDNVKSIEFPKDLDTYQEQ